MLNTRHPIFQFGLEYNFNDDNEDYGEDFSLGLQ